MEDVVKNMSTIVSDEETEEVIVEYMSTIVSDAETEDVIGSDIRIELPEDHPKFGELLNIACCYNANLLYIGTKLIVEVFNKELANAISEDLLHALIEVK